MPKWEALRSPNKHFAIYLLQFKRFRWIMKFDKKWIPKGHAKSSKIGAAGAQGPEFYGFMKFMEAPVLRCFLERQEVNHKSENN